MAGGLRPSWKIGNLGSDFCDKIINRFLPSDCLMGFKGKYSQCRVKFRNCRKLGHSRVTPLQNDIAAHRPNIYLYIHTHIFIYIKICIY